MSRQSADAALINDYIAKGQIVPVKITIGLLKNAMQAKGWEVGSAEQKCRYLIDGFPRNEDNVSGWNETVGEAADVKGIIYIKCSEDTMTERILLRGQHSGRTDDNKEVIKKRFVQYNTETFPIIERFQKEHRPVFEIDGEKGPEEVYASCLEQIKAFL